MTTLSLTAPLTERHAFNQLSHDEIADALALLEQYQELGELINVKQSLENAEQWERVKIGDFSQRFNTVGALEDAITPYIEFFNDCFSQIGHDNPSVTSDYDKSVIFEAIAKGME